MAIEAPLVYLSFVPDVMHVCLLKIVDRAGNVQREVFLPKKSLGIEKKERKKQALNSYAVQYLMEFDLRRQSKTNHDSC